MSIGRRDFLKAMGGGALIAASGGAAARPNREPLPDAVGLLYDATLCIGCKACVTACRTANRLPPEPDAVELSPATPTIIKAYAHGTAQSKDRAVAGYSFVKRQCMHCVDPVCVSVCPVSAMRKDSATGVVTHHPEVCIACRYCMVACPYNVPTYEYDRPLGQLRKCDLCAPRLAAGGLPACAEACPTGAVLFGARAALLEEAKRRIALKPGAVYRYPRLTLEASDGHEKPAPRYEPWVYGEKEGGGTQVLLLAGVPFELLGLPRLPERSHASLSETVQHTLYRGMIAPGLLLAGLLYVVRRNTNHGKTHAEGPDD